PRERPLNEWVQSAQKPAEAVKPAPRPSPPSKKKKRPASRNLIRHVLRARLNASRALANYLEELQRSDRLVLASQFVPGLDEGARVPVDKTPGDSNASMGLGASKRSASAAIAYLRSKGAKVAQLSARDSSDWAALSSDGEPETPFDDRSEDLVWVAPRS
ncbi:hypothetical protein FRC07_005785, partial [Ceratobasidium sp. 392]